MEFSKLEGSFGRWEVEFDKLKGEYFDNLGEEYIGSLDGEHSNNRHAYNKPGVDSVKVENDFGTMIIFLRSSSPHKKKLTRLLFSF